MTFWVFFHVLINLILFRIVLCQLFTKIINDFFDFLALVIDSFEAFIRIWLDFLIWRFYTFFNVDKNLNDQHIKLRLIFRLFHFFKDIFVQSWQLTNKIKVRINENFIIHLIDSLHDFWILLDSFVIRKNRYWHLLISLYCRDKSLNLLHSK